MCTSEAKSSGLLDIKANALTLVGRCSRSLLCQTYSDERKEVKTAAMTSVCVTVQDKLHLYVQLTAWDYRSHVFSTLSSCWHVATSCRRRGGVLVITGQP